MEQDKEPTEFDDMVTEYQALIQSMSPEQREALDALLETGAVVSTVSEDWDHLDPFDDWDGVCQYGEDCPACEGEE